MCRRTSGRKTRADVYELTGRANSSGKITGFTGFPVPGECRELMHQSRFFRQHLFGDKGGGHGADQGAVVELKSHLGSDR